MVSPVKVGDRIRITGAMNGPDPTPIVDAA